MAEYQAPVVIRSEELSEGVFAASGGTVNADVDGCSFINPTVTVNEQDFNTTKYRATIKADHVGKVNDRKGAVITLTSTVPLNNFVVRTSKYSSTDTAGTSFTIQYSGSHHSELNCEVEFTADSAPVLSAGASPA